MAKKQIKMGNKVRDIITGFEGIVVQSVETIVGTPRLGVQPKSAEPHQHPDAIMFDVDQLEYVDEGVVRLAKAPRPHEFKLWDKVRSKINKDNVGVVTAITTFLNGCVHLHVDREKNEKNTEDQFFRSVDTMELVEPAPKKRKSAPSGGPPTKAPKSMRA